MFENDRYITRGIAEEVNVEMQIFLWSLIDGLSVTKDYLQIFEISNMDDGVVRVVHKQEIPHYKKVYFLDIQSTPSTYKVFVIDSGTYSTMMLASEY